MNVKNTEVLWISCEYYYELFMTSLPVVETLFFLLISSISSAKITLRTLKSDGILSKSRGRTYKKGKNNNGILSVDCIQWWTILCTYKTKDWVRVIWLAGYNCFEKSLAWIAYFMWMVCRWMYCCRYLFRFAKDCGKMYSRHLSSTWWNWLSADYELTRNRKHQNN